MAGVLTNRWGGFSSSTLLANATTLSPNHVRPNATLSGGNLTLSTTTTGYQSACSLDARTSGHYYFECTIGAGFTTGMEIGVGVVDWRHAMNTFVGNTLGSCGGQAAVRPDFSNLTYNTGSGLVAVGSNPLGTSFAAGDVICIEWDADAGSYRARKNGGTWVGPYTIDDGSGNPKFPWLFVSGNGCTATLNFGASAWAYTPPSGATGWTTNGAYSGRYWRYYIRQSIYNGSANPNINIRETELRLTSAGADQTGSGTASASSDAGTSFSADKAVDNSTSTQWVCANNAGVNSYWQYDFGASNDKAITEFTWQIRSDLPFTNYPSRFHILFSSDGTVFYPAGHYEPTYTSQGETQTFACADG